jgi:hypothetical protein
MQREKTLRTMQLAISCISNIAAYRANWKDEHGLKTPIVQRDFWIRLNGNFLDMAVLEWCKLFADYKGKHHWSQTFTKEDEWRRALFADMSTTRGKFVKELKLVTQYRNKVVAHLDEPTAMNYPYTMFMLQSVSFLHDSLKNDSKTKRFFVGYYDTAESLYARRVEAAIDEVRFSAATEDEFIAQRTRFK